MKSVDSMTEAEHTECATEVLHALNKAQELKGSANEAYRGLPPLNVTQQATQQILHEP